MFHLGAKAKIRAAQAYASSASNTGYDLPADFSEVFKVEMHSSGTPTDTTFIGLVDDYEIDGDHIYFGRSGDYNLVYFKSPTELASVKDTVLVDEIFYLPMAYYIAAQNLTYSDEDHAEGNTLGSLRRSQFEIELQKACGQRAQRFYLPKKIRDVY